MYVVFLTLGTRGDLELFLILARELHGRGHRVCFGASPFFAAQVKEAGFEWAPVGDGTGEQLVKILHALARLPDKADRIRAFYKLWLQPQLEKSLPQIPLLGAKADYFINNLKMVLRRQGQAVPGAAVTYDPPGSVEELDQYGLAQHEGRILDLVAISKKLLDPQNLWDPRYRFTGFWGGSPPAPPTPGFVLEAFLRKGESPVVLTLGSMVMFDVAELARTFSEALRLTGRRGIIVGGWSDFRQVNISDAHVCCVSEVNYDWLFPQVCCVIHHGGCGTVAAVLRAGKPSILLPQLVCQEHFARLLMEEGLAAAILDTSCLTPEELGAAIQTAATERRLIETARSWSEVVSKERGVTAAADLIEEHWREIEGQGPINHAKA